MQKDDRIQQRRRPEGGIIAALSFLNRRSKIIHSGDSSNRDPGGDEAEFPIQCHTGKLSDEREKQAAFILK